MTVRTLLLCTLYYSSTVIYTLSIFWSAEGHAAGFWTVLHEWHKVRIFTSARDTDYRGGATVQNWEQYLSKQNSCSVHFNAARSCRAFRSAIEECRHSHAEGDIEITNQDNSILSLAGRFCLEMKSHWSLPALLFQTIHRSATFAL